MAWVCPVYDIKFILLYRPSSLLCLEGSNKSSYLMPYQLTVIVTAKE